MYNKFEPSPFILDVIDPKIFSRGFASMTLKANIKFQGHFALYIPANVYYEVFFIIFLVEEK